MLVMFFILVLAGKKLLQHNHTYHIGMVTLNRHYGAIWFYQEVESMVFSVTHWAILLTKFYKYTAAIITKY